MSRRDLLLAKAEARLKVSRSLIVDGFYEDTINRLHYAMFFNWLAENDRAAKT